MTHVESVAWSLLQQHCGLLYNRLHNPDPCSYPWLPASSLVLVVNETDSQLLALGARLRLALDVVNACCACRELDPATNQRFWRNVVLQLWTPGAVEAFSTQFPSHTEIRPSTAQSFTHYLLWIRVSRSVGRRFWHSFFYCDRTSPVVADCHAALQSVHATLQLLHTHTAMAGVRPLTIAVTVDGQTILADRSRDSAGYSLGDQGRIFYELVHYAAQSINDPRSTEVHLRLFVRHIINTRTDPLRLSDASDMAWVARAAGARVAVEGLELVLMHHQRTLEAMWSQISRLGELLRTVFTHGCETVATRLTVRCTLPITDHQFVGAVMSIVPAAETLVALECNHLFEPDEPNRLLLLAWLAYALYHPRSTEKELVAITSEHTRGLNDSEIQYLGAIVRARVPLRDVVGVVLETRHAAPYQGMQVECCCVGDTVTVACGSLLYYEPGRTTAAYVVSTLMREELLDLVAHVVTPEHSSMGVVYPGYGLVWVDASAIVQTSTLSDDDCIRGQTVASSLTLQLGVGRTRIGDAAMISLYAGAALRCLDLEGVDLTHDRLRVLVLQCHPALQSLVLRMCALDSVAALVDAYTETPPLPRCTVSSLSLVNVRLLDGSFAPLFQALSCSWHPMAKAMCELNVDLSPLHPTLQNRDILQLVKMLRQPRVRLRRVTVAVEDASEAGDTADALLEPLKGRLLSDPSPSIQRATLSVLRVVAGPLLCADVARTILAFVGGAGEQSISWTISLDYVK